MPRETTTRHQLRWRDVDMLGHVNQAVYHVLLEDARSALFADIGEDVGFNAAGDTYVLARVELDYRHEVRMDHGHVDVTARIAKVGTSSVTIENDMHLPDGTLAATGVAIVVAWSSEARGKRVLGEAERAALLGDG